MKALLILGLLIVGCDDGPSPLSNETTNNSGYKVSLLFEHDGCKIYRFVDAGYYRYFVNCGSEGSVEHTEKCGKSCTRPVEVPSTWDRK